MVDGALLEIRQLAVRYAGAPESVFSGLDLELAAGQCLAVVGPSGCGKSTLCRALLDLLPWGAKLSGSIRWLGAELTIDRVLWHRLRGTGLGLLLQDHRFALDPVRRIGDQVAEVVRHHRRELSPSRLDDIVCDLLAEVRFADPAAMARRYPHQLSGGQRQRACLAAALAAGPQLLLADEPTTALDLLVQREIIGMLRSLVDRRRLALLLVTHDRDLVPLVADRVFSWPQASGSRGQAPRCFPSARTKTGTIDPAACLSVRELSAAVSSSAGSRTVVHRLSLDLCPGRTLGLAGESGAGKTTLARVLAGWHPPLEGAVELVGVSPISRGERLRAVQLISQDAVAALDPRQRVLAAVAEAARAAGERGQAALELARTLLREVDLASDLERRPTAALSGGQRQRVQLARALAAKPRILIADEPASSLDAIRRNSLVMQLRRLQDQHGLALMVISHDLVWLEAWCDEVAVMLDGHLVELYKPGAANRPMHPFARDLASAACCRLGRETLGVRTLDDVESVRAPAAAEPAKGQVSGCPYALRCDLVHPSCRIALPDLRDRGGGHRLRCPPAERLATSK